MISYCKTLPDEPPTAPLSSAPTRAATVDISCTFPSTYIEIFVHGICVLGASYAKATSSNYSDLTYTLMPNCKDGVKLWGDRDYVESGIEGPD